jgi:hypothetical protein
MDWTKLIKRIVIIDNRERPFQAVEGRLLNPNFFQEEPRANDEIGEIDRGWTDWAASKGQRLSTAMLSHRPSLSYHIGQRTGSNHLQ